MRSVGKKKQIKKKQHHAHLQLPAGRVQKARHPLLTLAILFGGFFVLVSGLWIVSSSGVVANRFKPQLETELSKALQRQVTIGRIEGGLFDRVVLRDMLLSTRRTNPESLDITIRRVVVQYSLWDILIRKKSLAESLHHIQLIHPLIRIEKSPDGKWRGPQLSGKAFGRMTAGPAAPAQMLPKIKLTLVSGEIKISDGIHTASIKKLKGLLNLKDPAAARLFLSGRTDRWRRQNIRISGIMDLTTNSVKIRLNAGRVELAPLDSVVKLSDYFHIQKGQADLELKIHSREPTPDDLIAGFGIAGKMVLYDATLQSELIDDPVQNIFGVANLQDNNITLKNMQAILADIAWQARGVVKNIKTPYLNIRVQSDALELSELAARLPNLSSLGPVGAGKAAILIKGKAPDLTVTANFSMLKGKIGRLQIRKFEVITRYRDRELRLMLARGIFARGWVEGRGRILFPRNKAGVPHLSFRGDAKDLNLADIADLFHVEAIDGKVSGMLTVEGSLEKPTLYGKITSPKVRVSGMQFDAIQGQLEYNHDAIRLNFNTDWGVLRSAKFDIEAKREKKGWLLTRFLVSRGKRELLRAGGTWNRLGQDVLHGSLFTKNLPIQLIPMLPPEAKHLNGVLHFSGKISGTSELPLLQGTFNTDKLITYPGGKVSACGDIHLSSKKMELNNVWLDQKRIGLKGRLVYGEEPYLQSEMKMTRLPLKHFMILSGVKNVASISGLIEGVVEAVGPVRELKCKGDLRFHKPRWGDVKGKTGALKFSTNGKRIWVKEMELVQTSGKFKGVLETELSKTEGSFQILTWMESFEINKRNYTGDLKIKGTTTGSVSDSRYAAQLNLDNIEVDQHRFPPATGQMAFQGNRLTLKELKWGTDLSFSGEAVFGKKLFAKLQLQTQSGNGSHLERGLCRKKFPVHSRFRLTIIILMPICAYIPGKMRCKGSLKRV
ncbi:hypothetical protein K8S19_02320 [bacterium]|nr:hypothetical protein [bacterium]